MTYGLYLWRASRPEVTGSYGQCHAHVDKLSDAERMHGWTIQPLPSPRRTFPKHVRDRFWSLVGVGVLLFIATVGYLALRGH